MWTQVREAEVRSDTRIVLLEIWIKLYLQPGTCTTFCYYEVSITCFTLLNDTDMPGIIQHLKWRLEKII